MGKGARATNVLGGPGEVAEVRSGGAHAIDRCGAGEGAAVWRRVRGIAKHGVVDGAGDALGAVFAQKLGVGAFAEAAGEHAPVGVEGPGAFFGGRPEDAEARGCGVEDGGVVLDEVADSVGDVNAVAGVPVVLEEERRSGPA